MTTTYDNIYAMVCRIPKGRVATYGQIARMIGQPGWARQVGYALAALDEAAQVPWHRVVNARGEISPRAAGGYEEFQRVLLEDEGIAFDQSGRVDMSRFIWQQPMQDGPLD